MKEEMMNRIAEAVREEFGTECEVQFQDVVKNNGLVLKAIIIREPGKAVSPTVYIDEVLDQLTSGDIDIREAEQRIVSICRECRDKGDFEKIVSRLSRQSILEGVTYQLINAEKNKERLANMPHKRYLDLAAVYRVIVHEDEMGMESFLISNELLECYGVAREELDNAARRNTERKGFEMVSIDAIFAEIAGMPEDETETGCNMWVLTNTKKLNGATVLLYTDRFKNLAEKLGSDLYVLPSSIHEVIAVSVNGMNPEELKSIVCAINSSEVSEEEFLSGNIYKYIRGKNRLVIA